MWPKSFLGGTDLSSDLGWDNTHLLQTNELWTLKKISGLNYRQFGDRFKSFQRPLRPTFHILPVLQLRIPFPSHVQSRVLSGRFDPRVDRHNLPDRIFLPSILVGLSEIWVVRFMGGWMKGNEWAPRPISAKTAPVSTNRAVNFGYRAILLFCQRRVWWKNWRKSGWRLDFVFLTSMNAP